MTFQITIFLIPIRNSVINTHSMFLCINSRSSIILSFSFDHKLTWPATCGLATVLFFAKSIRFVYDSNKFLISRGGMVQCLFAMIVNPGNLDISAIPVSPIRFS